MTPEDILLKTGFDSIRLLNNLSYDDALIGVTHDGRAVYDYDKMIQWLVDVHKMTQDQAVEWIEHNTLVGLKYFGLKSPLIMYKIP